MRPTLAAITLLFVVGTAGCAGSSGDPTVPTAESGAPKASAGAAANGQDSDLKYSQCMRDEGLSWFPDRGADGGLKVSVPEGQQSTFEKAEEACKEYAPGANRSGGPISEEDLTKLRQMAQCIRDHGFPKWPDPDANGGTTVDSTLIGAEPNDPAFQQAMQECEKYRPARKDSGNS
jgi:hypothetical protein